jgi:hypothetical protein
VTFILKLWYTVSLNCISVFLPGVDARLGHTPPTLDCVGCKRAEAATTGQTDFYGSRCESQRMPPREGPCRGWRALGCTRVDIPSRTSSIAIGMKEENQLGLMQKLG